MEISTKLNSATISAINRLWQSVSFNDSRQGKINKNIVEVVASKFIKKQLSRVGKPDKKEFTLPLNFYQAATLETYLRAAAYVAFDFQSLEFIQVIKYCDQLHQKTQ